MQLSPTLEKTYTRERYSALEAQRMAEFIAWGPVIFQTARIMIKHGILQMIVDSKEGLTRAEICERTGLSDYAVKCLTEASLTAGIIIVDTGTDRFTLSKVGWFLLNNEMTRANIDFNHDVNYEGWFRLEESLVNGKPEGLRHFGTWPTVYEALSELPEQVQQSWFGFDHYYSDHSFDEALRIVFDEHKTRHLLDVGGNTGRWALRCVGHDKDVHVTILDLPQQIAMMRKHTQGKEGAERIDGYGINLLDATQSFPQNDDVDAIWMSQFLDCFSMDEIISILRRAKEAMNPGTRLYIMETLWDRQRFDTAALCLTMTSLYFSAIANGNSKMYNTDDMTHCIQQAGLEIEKIYDALGKGHSVIVVRKRS